MATDIDTLQIQINAQAQKANTAIDTLVRKLDRLTTSLSKIDSSKLNSLSSGIDQLATSVTQMNGVKSDNLVNVTKTLNKIAKIDYSKLNAAGSGLSTLSQGMATIGGLGNLSNVTPAVNAIKNLARTDLSGFDTGKMQTIASTLSSFANQLGTSTKIDASVTKIISAMARLANSGQSIGNVSAYFPVLGQHVTSLVQSLSGAGAIDIGVAKVVDGIARLASAGNKVGITVANLQSLGDGVVNLVNRLNALPKVNSNIANLILGLGNIASSGTRAGSVVGGLSTRLNAFSNSASTSTKKAFSLASAIGKVYASYWMSFRAFRLIGKAINISSDLTEVQNVVDVTFGDMAYKVEEFAKNSIEQFGMSELALKQYSSRFQSMGTNMGVNNSALQKASEFLSKQTNGYVELSDSMSDVSLTLTKLTADMASFYNVEQKDVAEDLASIFTGQTRPLRTYGLDLTEATLKEWALKNGLDANIDAMTQAEKTMLRYQYVLSNTGAAHGDFARTADTWANQVRILKENFRDLGKTLGGSFIGFLKPVVKALNVVIGKLKEFAVAVSNSLGKIFGWKYEDTGGGMTSDIEDAESASGGVSDNLGSAADNAKKLKNNLLGIDELNVLSNDDTSGSGSSSGGGGIGGGGSSSADGGNWTKTESLLDYESELDTLYKLGDYIGTKLTTAMNNIGWKKVYKGAENFGTGLANFLNGLISPELFGAVGTTIAGALNTALHTALAFGETFDFYDFGVSIATGINNFFATFEFETLAETLNTWVDDLKEAIQGFLDTITWESILEGAGDFLGTLELDTVSVIIGTILIKKLLGMHLVGTALSIIGTSVSRSIAQAIASKLGIELAADAGIKTALTTGLTKAFNGISWTKVLGGLAGIASIIGGVAIAVKNFFSMWENGFSWLNEALMVLGIALGAVGAVILGVPAAIAGVVAGIVAAIATVAIVVHDNWDAIVSFFTEAIPAFLEEHVKPWFTVEKWQEIFGNIKSAFTKKWNEIVGWWKTTAIYKWWDDDVKPWFTVEKWKTEFDNIKKSLKEKWDEIKEWWSNTAIAKWWDEDVKPWFSLEKWKEVLSDIPKAFKEGFKNAANAAIEIFNKLIGWINDKMNFSWDSITILGKEIIPAGNIQLFTIPKIPKFESGGFVEPNVPSQYSLIMAGEHGNAELIGSVGGKTAVAGGAEITGISNAVYSTSEQEIRELREMNNLLRRLLEKDTSVNIGDREIYKASLRGAKASGRLLVT